MQTFELASPEATRAKGVCATLLESKPTSLNKIETELKTMLLEIIRHSVTCTSSINRQTLWSSYHQAILSAEFKKMWAAFFQQHGKESCALVSQSITQYVVDRLIKEQFPQRAPSSDRSSVKELTIYEQNTL